MLTKSSWSTSCATTASLSSFSPPCFSSISEWRRKFAFFVFRFSSKQDDTFFLGLSVSSLFGWPSSSSRHSTISNLCRPNQRLLNWLTTLLTRSLNSSPIPIWLNHLPTSSSVILSFLSVFPLSRSLSISRDTLRLWKIASCRTWIPRPPFFASLPFLLVSFLFSSHKQDERAFLSATHSWHVQPFSLYFGRRRGVKLS